MKLDLFDYELPEHLIAQYPLQKRDESKLMIVDRVNQTIKHDEFKNILNYIPAQSHFVFNNTKVIPARLIGKREFGTGQVELFLLKKCDGQMYEVLMRPMKRLKEGEHILFEDDLKAKIISKEKRLVRFNREDITGFLDRYGHIPLPPYIQRPDQIEDKEQYQTVYAKEAGSVAAPTAGLHFSESLLSDIDVQGHLKDEVTLHINYGTFKPVVTEDILDHDMHTEMYQMDQSVIDRIDQSKRNKQKIIAVGTTSSRTLESYAKNKQLTAETNLFIYPGYAFQYVDALVTNFHLPKSTLLMLVYAFGGATLMKEAYAQAIKEQYRFFSYGDAMLIL